MEWLRRLLIGFLRRPMHVRLKELFGSRPNDRERAERYGDDAIRPALELGREVVIEFDGTGLMTQSFFHALLSAGLSPDMTRVEHLRVIGANAQQLQALELALKLMAKTHARRPRVEEELFDLIDHVSADARAEVVPGSGQH